MINATFVRIGRAVTTKWKQLTTNDESFETFRSQGSGACSIAATHCERTSFLSNENYFDIVLDIRLSESEHFDEIEIVS